MKVFLNRLLQIHYSQVISFFFFAVISDLSLISSIAVRVHYHLLISFPFSFCPLWNKDTNILFRKHWVGKYRIKYISCFLCSAAGPEIYLTQSTCVFFLCNRNTSMSSKQWRNVLHEDGSSLFSEAVPSCIDSQGTVWNSFNLTNLSL